MIRWFLYNSPPAAFSFRSYIAPLQLAGGYLRRHYHRPAADFTISNQALFALGVIQQYFK